MALDREPDYEMWLAMHEDCPIYGCGQCVNIEMDIDETNWFMIRRAASLQGEHTDVFMMRAITEGLRMLGLPA